MELTLDEGSLVIKLRALEKLAAFHGSLRIPLDSIEKTSTDTPASSWRDLRAPGTHMPKVIKAGTYFTKRGREFWYVTKRDKILTIELKRGFYKRVILTHRDNQDWSDRINSSI